MKKLNGLTKQEYREKMWFQAVCYRGLGQGYGYSIGKYDDLKDDPDLVSLDISFTQPEDVKDAVDTFRKFKSKGSCKTFNEFFNMFSVDTIDETNYYDCVRYGKIIFVKYFETKKGFEAIKLFKIKNSLFLFHMINNEVKFCQEVSNELKTPAE